MADSFTPNYNFVRPEPGGSVDTWGLKLNANFGDLDTLLKGVADDVVNANSISAKKSANLSDLGNVATARNNLGLGTAATLAAGTFAYRSNNLSDLNNAATARNNLGLGTAATQADTRYAHRGNNLSDLTNASAARGNLSLGTAAIQSDGRYMHRNNSLSDVGSPASARTNLGLGSAATQNSTTFCYRGNNLSDLSNVGTARSNLGLGAAATLNTTSSRTSSSTNHLLVAAAMNTHRTSSDHDARYLRRGASGTLTGNLSVTGNITAYSSDARLKDVLHEIGGAVSALKKIRAVKFRWNEAACEEAMFTPTQSVEHGVLAQEVKRILPDAVHRAAFNEDYLTVDYSRLTVLLIAAVKELAGKIEGLQK